MTKKNLQNIKKKAQERMLSPQQRRSSPMPVVTKDNATPVELGDL
jgi:hypothetical protein